MTKDICVLDVGTGKITFVVGNRTSNGVFSIKNFGEAKYEGVYDDEWVRPEGVVTAIKQAIEFAHYNGKIKNLYIGVPSPFIRIITQRILTNLGTEKTVGQRHIDKIFKTCEQYKISLAGYVNINTVAINYLLDNKISTDNPIGYSASTVATDVSYTLCNSSFTNMIEFCLQDYGLKKISYIYSDWATAVSFSRDEERKNGLVFCTIGYLDTSYCYIRNEGILTQSSIPVGRGNIEGEYFEKLGVDFPVAADLTSRLDLEADFGDNYGYYIKIDGQSYKLDGFKINKIAMSIIAEIVDFISAKITEGKVSNPDIYLGGGYLSDIRGAIKRLNIELKKNIKEIKPSVPMYEKEYYAPMFGVLSIASRTEREKQLWGKIFR